MGASAVGTTTSASSFISGASGPTVGTGATITTAGDTFSPTVPYSGSFASGNWTFTWNARASTAGLVGRLGMRVWASVNANGSSARELTSGEIFSSSVTLSTSVNTNWAITWAAPAITLNNEYIFFQLEYQEQTSAGSSNNDNAIFRVGSSIVTTNFAIAWAGTAGLAPAPLLTVNEDMFYAAKAALAPAAILTVNEDMFYAARATLAPTTTLAANLYKLIGVVVLAPTAILDLSVNEDLWMVAQAALAPAAALTVDATQVPGAAVTTVYDQVFPMAGNSSDQSLFNNRIVYDGTLFSAASGNKIRVSLLFHGSDLSTYPFGPFYIGRSGATAPNFAGDQVQLLFGGNAIINAPTANPTTIVSDWATLAQNWDNTKSYTASWFIGAVSGFAHQAYATGFSVAVWDEGSSHASTADQTISSATLSYIGTVDAFLIAKIEIQAGGATAWSGAAALAPSATLGANLTTLITYVGPGDIIPFKVWFGLRAYSAATVGQKAVTIKRASDNTSQDFVTLTSGQLDVASINAFLASTTGTVTQLWDQVSNTAMLVVGTDPAPAYTANAFNSSSGLTFSGGQSLVASALISQAQPYTWWAVAQQTTTNAGFGAILTLLPSSNPDGYFGFDSAGANIRFRASTANIMTAAAANGTPHFIVAAANATSSSIFVDGTQTTGTVSTTTIGADGTDKLSLGNNGGSSYLIGLIFEAGLIAADATTNASALTTNASSYYTTGAISWAAAALLAPTSALAASALQTMVAQAALAPNAALAAIANTFIFIPSSGVNLARGFGPTLGGSASDIITTSFTTASPGQRSYSAWLWANSAGTSNRLFQKDNTTFNNESVFLHGPSGTPPSVIEFQAMWQGGGAGGQWTCPLLSLQNWHHLVITYDNTSASNTPAIYVDSVAQSVTLYTAPIGSILTNSDPFTIGNRAADLTRVWDGLIDDFAIWDGILLSQTDVNALYAKTPPSSVQSSFLVAYWPITGQSPEPDVVGGKNGTVSGTAVAAGLLSETVALAPAGNLAADATKLGAATQWSGNALLAPTGTLAQNYPNLFEAVQALTAPVGALIVHELLITPGLAALVPGGGLSFNYPNLAEAAQALVAPVGALVVHELLVTPGQAALIPAGTLALNYPNLSAATQALAAPVGALVVHELLVTPALAALTPVGVFAANTNLLEQITAIFLAAGNLTADATKLGAVTQWSGSALLTPIGALALNYPNLSEAVQALAVPAGGLIVQELLITPALTALSPAGLVSINANLQEQAQALATPIGGLVVHELLTTPGLAVLAPISLLGSNANLQEAAQTLFTSVGALGAVASTLMPVQTGFTGASALGSNTAVFYFDLGETLNGLASLSALARLAATGTAGLPAAAGFGSTLNQTELAQSSLGGAATLSAQIYPPNVIGAIFAAASTFGSTAIQTEMALAGLATASSLGSAAINKEAATSALAAAAALAANVARYLNDGSETFAAAGVLGATANFQPMLVQAGFVAAAGLSASITPPNVIGAILAAASSLGATPSLRDAALALLAGNSTLGSASTNVVAATTTLAPAAALTTNALSYIFDLNEGFAATGVLGTIANLRPMLAQIGLAGTATFSINLLPPNAIGALLAASGSLAATTAQLQETAIVVWGASGSTTLLTSLQQPALAVLAGASTMGAGIVAKLAAQANLLPGSTVAAAVRQTATVQALLAAAFAQQATVAQRSLMASGLQIGTTLTADAHALPSFYIGLSGETFLAPVVAQEYVAAVAGLQINSTFGSPSQILQQINLVLANALTLNVAVKYIGALATVFVGNSQFRSLLTAIDNIGIDLSGGGFVATNPIVRKPYHRVPIVIAKHAAIARVTGQAPITTMIGRGSRPSIIESEAPFKIIEID